MRKTLLLLCIGLLALAGCTNNPTAIKNLIVQPTPTPVPLPELAFPFSDPDAIERLAPFGEPNWSGTEPHNGIDLIIYASLDKTELVSPVSGTITKIEIRENPYSNPVNQLIVDVQISVTSVFTINLVIEPSTNTTATKNEQTAALSVSVHQTVSAGDRIGDLIVGEHGYPHLHYMVTHQNQAVCAHHYSSTAAKNTFLAIATRSSSEVCK